MSKSMQSSALMRGRPINQSYDGNEYLTEEDIVTLQVGYSLAVPFNVLEESYIRARVSYLARKHKMRLSVLKHNNLQVFEIGRLA